MVISPFSLATTYQADLTATCCPCCVYNTAGKKGAGAGNPAAQPHSDSGNGKYASGPQGMHNTATSHTTPIMMK